VLNVAPTLTISGATSVNEDAVYTLGLSATDPGTDTITGWTIQWGDGTSSTVAGTPQSVTHVYVDGPNLFTVTATASDEDGTHTANSIGVSVNNLPPVLTISGAASTNEAALYTLSLSAIVRGADPIGSWTINWGDGSNQSVSGNPSSVTHVYTDGPTDYSITATANDGDGDFAASSSVSVHVNNLPPTITAVMNNGPVNEASPSTITVTANDPAGAADPLRYEFDCNNDGTYEIGLQSGNSAACTFADNGTFTVKVRVSDGDGGETLGSTSVSVLNVRPVASVTGPATGIRGLSQSFVLGALDVSTVDQTAGFTFAINWGDGSVESVGPGTSSGVSRSHAYMTAGQFTVQLTATDKDNGTSLLATHTIQSLDSGGAALEGGNLVVVGTSLGDEIVVNQDNHNPNLFYVRFDVADDHGDDDDDDENDDENHGGLTFVLPVGGHIIVFGFEGDDEIRVRGSVAAEIFGEAGNDSIRTGSGNDVINSGVGNDTIDSGLGDDVIYAGAGLNRIRSDGGNDTITTGADNDDIDAGSGNDVVYAGAGNDLVDGGEGQDLLVGEAGLDRIDGGSGNDRIDGGADADMLLGGEGDDVILGGAGNDELQGGSGNDVLVGGFGSDRIMGNSGHDVLIAGELNAALFNSSFSNLRSIGDAWASQFAADSDLADSNSDGDILDEAFDQLEGGSGRDWFILGQADTITDLKASAKDGDRIQYL
jgi:Ca2+-binding RTX toxin-like protein